MEVKLSQLLRAISQAADLGEAKELGHAQRVLVLAHALAGATGSFARGELAELAVACLLHDIGMSSVTYSLHLRVGSSSRALLSTYPGPARGHFGRDDSDDREIAALLGRHVETGSRLLQQLGYGAGATRTVELHHARVDGSGHPATAGDDLPVGAQILALADVLETATYQLDTVEARLARAQSVLETASGRLIGADLSTLAHDQMLTTEVWERVLFFDEVEALLDDLFEHTYGTTVEADGLEAHLRLLAQFVDAQSPYAAGQTVEVARLAQRMGERIGLDAESLGELQLASLLHSAGRVGIASDIIEKGGGLSEEEFLALHAYPNLTREVLAPLEPLRSIVDAASTHREKLDGSGYPEARAGDEIPLVGRILSVADTFVALTSERPYRSAYSRSRALAIVQAESARLFDGLVTDALELVYREGL